MTTEVLACSYISR